MKLSRPVVRLVEEALVLLFQVPLLVSVVRLEALVQLDISSEEGTLFKELTKAKLDTRCLLQDFFRSESALFSNEELNDVPDDLSYEWCKRRAVRVHLIHHEFQQVAHPLDHMVL